MVIDINKKKKKQKCIKKSTFFTDKYLYKFFFTIFSDISLTTLVKRHVPYLKDPLENPNHEPRPFFNIRELQFLFIVFFKLLSLLVTIFSLFITIHLYHRAKREHLKLQFPVS